jgi:DNA-binding NarL/FixJ family response regulator
MVNYNKDTIAAMLKQNEKKNQQEQQQQQQQEEERIELSKREIQILNCIKGQSRIYLKT